MKRLLVIILVLFACLKVESTYADELTTEVVSSDGKVFCFPKNIEYLSPMLAKKNKVDLTSDEIKLINNLTNISHNAARDIHGKRVARKEIDVNTICVNEFVVKEVYKQVNSAGIKNVFRGPRYAIRSWGIVSFLHTN